MNNRKSISIILISLGSFLEIFYYFARFKGDGTHWSISVIQGIALTALLMGLFLMRSKAAVWFLIIPLIGYSIFNTAAGQRQSLTAKAEGQAIGINNQKISDLEESLQRKKDRLGTVSDLVNNSITDFDEMWEWKNTTSKYEEEISTLDTDMESIEFQISNLRDTKIEDSEIGKLYSFYSNLIGLSAEWLQFWLQIALSAFIAIMAPVGILLFPVKKEDEIDWYPLVKKWVNTNWIGVRNNSNRHILSKDKFIEHHALRGFAFRADLYDRILSAAIKCKSVDKDTITLDNEIEAIEAILSKLRK